MTTAVTAAQDITSATREYVKITKTVEVEEPVYTLKLTKLQAGYLRDILQAHIKGEIREFLSPVRTALSAAGAEREYGANTNRKTSVYDDGFPHQVAVVDFANDYDRERAGFKKRPAAVKAPSPAF